jgi:hypothetical protein
VVSLSLISKGHKFFNMKSNEYKLYIKIVELGVIYNFLVDKFFIYFFNAQTFVLS